MTMDKPKVVDAETIVYVEVDDGGYWPDDNFCDDVMSSLSDSDGDFVLIEEISEDLREFLSSNGDLQLVPTELCNSSAAPVGTTKIESEIVLANGKVCGSKVVRSQCSTCHSLIDVNEFKTHSKKCKLEKLHRCSKCGDQFNLLRNLEIHYLIKHSEPTVAEDGAYQCSLCEKSSVRISAFYAHLQMHMENDVLQCPHCEHEYDYTASLYRHIFSHHPQYQEGAGADVVEVCIQCGIFLLNKEDMAKHVSVHRSINRSMKRTKRKRNRDPYGKKYQCPHCSKSFTKNFELSRHLVVHTKKKEFICDVCGKGFSQKSSLTSHHNIHISSSTHKCPLCNATFKQAGNLRLHIAVLHPINVDKPREPYRCTRCPCVFRSMQPLRVHLRRRHSINFADSPDVQCKGSIDSSASALLSPKDGSFKQPICCPHCGKAYRSEFDMLKHCDKHHGNRPFPCQLCNREFSLESSLKLHVKNHSREFSSSESFMRHKISRGEFLNHGEYAQDNMISEITNANNPPSVANFTILNEESSLSFLQSMDQINFQIQDSMDTSNANENQPIDQTIFLAQDMNAPDMNDDDQAAILSEFFWPSGRITSEKLAKDLPSEIRCPYCYFSYYSVNHLIEHLSNRSQDDVHRPCVVRCCICDDIVTETSSFINHLQSSHSSVCTMPVVPIPTSNIFEDNRKVTEEKRHSCEVCGKSFKKSNDLKRHMRIHTGEKPYSCEICGRCFSLTSGLNQHKSVHTFDESNIVCTICKRSYCTQSSLRSHIRSAHAGEIPRRSASVSDNFNAEEQLIATAEQLAPNHSWAKEFEPSEHSAFKIPGEGNFWKYFSYLSVDVLPQTDNDVEVVVGIVRSAQSSSSSILVELSSLRSLSPGASIQLSLCLPFLPQGSLLSIDIQRVLELLNQQNETRFVVPLNIRPTVSGLPLEICTQCSAIVMPSEPDYLTSCDVCEENFLNKEDSVNHFAGVDHEVAQLSLVAEPNSFENEIYRMNQYHSVAASNLLAEVCKFCLAQFHGGEDLLAHIRQEHGIDGFDGRYRFDVVIRPRTME